MVMKASGRFSQWISVLLFTLVSNPNHVPKAGLLCVSDVCRDLPTKQQTGICARLSNGVEECRGWHDQSDR